MVMLETGQPTKEMIALVKEHLERERKERRIAACRENGKKGGRPKNSKKK